MTLMLTADYVNDKELELHLAIQLKQDTAPFFEIAY